MSCDIVLANVPKTHPNGPYLAPFLLKSVVQNAGYTCKTFDWNRDAYENQSNAEMWLDELKKADPKWFGLSFMNRNQFEVATDFLKLVKEKLPHIKTVVGGYCIGIEDAKMGRSLKNEGLVDYFINGEGENALIELLNGNDKSLGINSMDFPTPVDLSTLPVPDYSDVLKYKYGKYFICGSRGCPINCNFCTENKFSKRYRYRTAESIAKEITTIKKQTGISSFHFTDSLINGNMKQFRKLCELIKDAGVIWQGYFSLLNSFKEEDCHNAVMAGLTSVSIGVESGSEKIRKEMGKGSTDETLYRIIKCFAESDLEINILIIIGWPTETENDFQDTLNLVKEISKYGQICLIHPGTTLLADPDMNFAKQYNIVRPHGNRWSYMENTFDVRRSRWFRLVEYCKELGVRVDEQHIDRMEVTDGDV